MPTTESFSGDAALAALTHRDLVPPPRPPQFTAGATAELRDAMARFSGPEEHEARRTPIVDRVAAIDLAEVARIATSITDEHLADTVDVVALSWTVPTYALAAALGLTVDREQLRADTEAVARVIGRNEPSSAASDEATERLLTACADQPDPVAAASILYQNHDATSGLIRSQVMAAYTDREPPNPASTRRVATAPVTIEGCPIATDDEIVISLAGMTYGAGPHRCPGEELAGAIAHGVLESLQKHRYASDPDDVDVDANGAATRLILSQAQ